jgi:hypothetical protein
VLEAVRLVLGLALGGAGTGAGRGGAGRHKSWELALPGETNNACKARLKEESHPKGTEGQAAGTSGGLGGGGRISVGPGETKWEQGRPHGRGEHRDQQGPRGARLEWMMVGSGIVSCYTTMPRRVASSQACGGSIGGVAGWEPHRPEKRPLLRWGLISVSVGDWRYGGSIWATSGSKQGGGGS